MEYKEIKPTPPLCAFVECFWTLVSKGPCDSSLSQRILPDGCVEIVLNFGHRFLQQIDGKRKLQPRNFIVGQMTGPVLISVSGTVELLGIRFQPGGTRPFLETPAHEITNQVFELGSVSSKLERDLIQICTPFPTLGQRIAAADEYLSKRLIESRYDSQIIALGARILERGGLVSLDYLTSAAGISGRQLQRLFLREVGIGPKLLARIVRFQQVFRAVEQCSAWAAVAAACGYYDQAHLIHDFNQFAGQTPAVLLASHSQLTESFTRKTRMSHFSNTAA